MKAMMQHCAKNCRWCPLIPITIGVIFFSLGFYLDAETVRLMWLILSGFLVLMGTMGLLMMNIMAGNKK